MIELEAVGLMHFLILGISIFTIGICGIFINRKSVITVMMSIELMLLSINIIFISFSAYQNNLTGQIFSIMILSVAAAEAAIGLAILVVYFRNRRTIDIDDISHMRG